MSTRIATADASGALSALVRALSSSVGAKAVMAVSGAFLIVFLFGHVSGNLLVWSGPDAINGYAAFLHSHTGLLWGMRAAVVVALLLHGLTSVRLTLENREARPVGYATRSHRAATFSGLNMIWTGLLALAYLVYHLLHFTVGSVHSAHFKDGLPPAGGLPDVYTMVVRSFSHPGITPVYAVAMVLLGLHLSHAISSAFQTLGLTNTRYRPVIERLGPAVATVLVVGFLSVPLGVLAGWVR